MAIFSFPICPPHRPILACESDKIQGRQYVSLSLWILFQTSIICANTLSESISTARSCLQCRNASFPQSHPSVLTNVPVYPKPFPLSRSRRKRLLLPLMPTHLFRNCPNSFLETQRNLSKENLSSFGCGWPTCEVRFNSLFYLHQTNKRPVNDNKALSRASKQAQQDGIPLLALFIISPQDYIAHDIGARKIDFVFRNLYSLKVRVNVITWSLIANEFYVEIVFRTWNTIPRRRPETQKGHPYIHHRLLRKVWRSQHFREHRIRGRWIEAWHRDVEIGHV